MLWVIIIAAFIFIPQVRWVLGVMFLGVIAVGLLQWVGIAPEGNAANSWYWPTTFTLGALALIGEFLK